MKTTKNLILYRDFENEQLFYDFTWVMENYQNEYYNKEDVEGLFYECLKKLMELAVSHGFSGNLWHNFLAFLLVNNENAYSRACEIRGEIKGSINEVARHDFAIMKELFDFDLSVLGNYFSVDCMDALLHYEETADAGKLFNKRIRDRIAELCRHLEAAADAEEFKQAVTAFYGEFGVGKLGLHKAFRIRHTDDGAQIIPITNIAHVKLDDLVGYELAKQKLMGLYGVVPTLRAMDVRFACAKTDETSFDFVLTADFDDRDGLEAYRVHPAHRAVSAFMGAVREGRACVDFEI